ncbi:MAG: GlxA family transcriptional regulator [Alphaproteobacteria bacterium]|jgi:transcriptional regulator GlxA family with amidase domain|nr:GlxA family transcriptional regulator [Alphaproteobacteria bacterium]MDP6567033.1 GlxA family transcriptional regulator [Alphaproteobacteria bacterium]MDP6812453.1 GlxA family transcriptional regulator [Alphaproteobacteria bacterium]
MTTDSQAHDQHHIAFVLMNDFSMIAFAASIEPLRLANLLSGRELYSWSCLSIDGKPVAASNGLTAMVDGAIDELRQAAMVVVCTGINVERLRPGERFRRALRYQASHGATIGAICTGAYVLARAGLLRGYRCTIHWESLKAFAEEFPRIEVTAELFEVDRDRMTSAGGTAALDMMLHYVAGQHGQGLATGIAEMMMHHRIRSGDDAQRLDARARLGISHAGLLAAVTRMEENLEQPLRCSDIAREVGLSPRQLERLFRKYLGCTPSRYYLWLRLDQSRLLLAQTSLSVLNVALACGFVSASHFSKCYRERYERTPSQERHLLR